MIILRESLCWTFNLEQPEVFCKYILSVMLRNQKVFFVTLVILTTGVYGQSCEAVNSSTITGDLDPQEFIIGDTTNDPMVVLCECPTGTQVNAANQACTCTGANQIFNGDECLCKAGFVKLGGTCSLCQFPCVSCNEQVECVECASGYVLQELKCIEVSADVAGIASFGGQVVECTAGCSECTIQGGCTACVDGYYLAGTECSLCTTVGTNCKTCNSGGCVTCYFGFSVQDQNCNACSDLCLTCDSTGCTSCLTGYFLDGTTCSTCTDTNCVNCPGNICSQCKVGYVAIAQECTECLSGCNVCSAGSFTQCLGCANGYYLDQQSKCAPCKIQCKTCTSASVCTACQEGYRLVESSCILACVFPCETCLTTNPNSCTTCYGGYVKSGTVCTVSTDCNDDSSCKFCPREFYLSSGNCNPCNIDNCINCKDESQTIICTRCKPGFTLAAAGGCQPCPSQCKTCNSAIFCTACQPGFYLQSIDGQSTGKCKACDTKFGCATCKSEGYKCVTCITGYSLKGVKCLTDKKIAFKITVSGEKSFFYSIINTFKDSILGNMGLTPVENFRHLVTLEFLEDGSVVVSGSVSMESADKTSETESRTETLNQLFKPGFNIEGFQVVSSEIATTTTTTTEEAEEESDNASESNTNNNNRVGLIVGFSILGAFLLIIVVVWIIVTAKKSPTDIEEELKEGTETDGNIKEKADIM